MDRFSGLLTKLTSYGELHCVVEDGAAYTFSQLIEESCRWQPRLDDLGVQFGDVVALSADYSLQAIAALLALFMRAAIVALVPRGPDQDAYVSDAYASGLLALDVGDGYHYTSTGMTKNHPLIQALRKKSEAGIILFTSGSSGRPKAALHSVERFLQKFSRPGRRMRTLAFLLLDHVAGLDTLFYTLANGGSLILTRQRNVMSVVRAIELHQVEVLPTSPSFLRLLCATEETFGRDLSSLRVITYGSEPMDPSTLKRLNTRLPSVEFIQKYGTTETGSPRSVSRSKDSLWLKLKDNDVETKVIDGILWIRGEGTILGYLNCPSPIDEEGWYCTGDAVETDGEWIKFRGRASDIINVGGEKVSPAEIEEAILELDFICEALVFGEPHPLLGQVAGARVTLGTPMEPKEAARRIRTHCRQRLAPYKVPVRIETVAGSLANERQKVLRARATNLAR